MTKYLKAFEKCYSHAALRFCAGPGLKYARYLAWKAGIKYEKAR